jgi:hypothetical protein
MLASEGTITAMKRELADAKLLASILRTYPTLSIAASTRFRVDGLTVPAEFITRETVIVDT